MITSGPGPSSLELEIKLSGTPDVIACALRSDAVRPLLEGRPGSRLLRTIYYDTPDGQLREQRVALRLRQQGSRWVQTLKRDGGVVGGLHEREEIEHTVLLQQPDYALYDETPSATLFADIEVRSRIQPVFATSFRRTTRLLRLGSSRIELAFDRGVIEAQDRQSPICELELELKQGDLRALYTLAERLCRDFDLRLEHRSKAERGYALLAGTPDAPGRARPVSLDRSQSPADAFIAIASECLRHLHANERGIIDGADPEYIHQARVALRRLRAALALFRPVVGCPSLLACDDELRALARVLGTARDWDVFCVESLPRLPELLDVGGGRAAISGLASPCRAQANLVAREAIAARQFALLMLRFGAALRTRVWENETAPSSTTEGAVIDTQGLARRALDQAWRRTRKRAREAHEDRPDSYHPMRLAMKRLRYGGEFFAVLFPPKGGRNFLRDLARLQDRLGQLNDAATALRLTGTLREGYDDPGAREMLGVLRGFYVAQLLASSRAARKTWKVIKDSTRFWAGTD